MATFPTAGVSWKSEIKSVPNTAIDTMESGAKHAYAISDADWYDVTLINVVYHDNDRAIPDAVDAFYTANRLDENIKFECKGYYYVGLFTSRPTIEQLKGFGRYRITSTFHARRTGAVLPVPMTEGGINWLAYYLQQRGPL